jgi:hypothetical protein
MPEETDVLVAELRSLGASILVEPPAEDLVERVLARIAVEPRRTRTRWPYRGARGVSPPKWTPSRARRRRLVAVIIALVIIGLGLTPPVRAAVVEWLRIGGVLIKTAPPASGPSPTAEPPPTRGAAVTVEQAQGLVAFPIGLPADLGAPDRIEVSADRRVVSMDWTSGRVPIHLDQFDGSLDWIFVKKSRGAYEVTTVGGRDGVWFLTAHEVSYVDRGGQQRTEQARIAAPCLVWERPAGRILVTMRLEGDIGKARAIEIAESIR